MSGAWRLSQGTASAPVFVDRDPRRSARTRHAPERAPRLARARRPPYHNGPAAAATPGPAAAREPASRTARATTRPPRTAAPTPARRALGAARARAGSSATTRSARTWRRSRATRCSRARRSTSSPCAYRETGDVDAAYRLVASNLRLVVKIAHEYRRTAFQLLDLVQEGNIGLMQAVKKYDPWKGVKLSSYAAWWIRAYILRFVMDNWRMVKLGTTQAQRKLFFNLRKERRSSSPAGIEPTPQLLAKNLDVEEQDVEEMTARMAGGATSRSTRRCAGDEDDARQTRLDRVAVGRRERADERIGDEQLRRLFREKLDAFAEDDPRREGALHLRAAAPAAGRRGAAHAAGDRRRFKLTRERARQIEAKLTARLREYLRAEIPDFELLGPPEDVGRCGGAPATRAGASPRASW